jgi:hypothetical protein
VLPWFEEASDPELIVTSRAGDCTNNPSALVEWLASRDRPDLMDGYVRRYLARNPGASSAYEEGRAKADSGMPFSRFRSANLAERLGWSVTKFTNPATTA